ncbi:Prepilin-type N-terminal cleavage/methylation domain-containing protein [Pseudomonas sp. OF001]|uniref:PilW family protein n=1 Tax=unclassified Pseudomonas TaxID=196821 RepID=UPI0010A68A1B|nr:MULTISPECIES: prepilin-type N-terminal cleavage/methylation domain-containing protein [unclassified Pseudomonas]THG83895.1 prepilin-type N-terminal cleavage/methylation domain-containing protein [Pseudomonas sp. A-1]CAD5379880.1 Prepilin-type N-terminal cleavage/methylation domain-containing protein [Pseudomonas sp. OF001]
MKQQRGFSLVELMVALLISSLLLLGILQLFNNTSESDRTANALARVQEGGRVALEIIGTDARRTGYQGCSSIANETTVGSYTFPEDALAVAANSVTFRYASTEKTGNTPEPVFSASRACDGTELYLRTVTYAQCNNGTSLCMTLNGGSADPILDNAVIDSIFFAIPGGGTTRWVESAALSESERDSALAMRIQLTISDPRSDVTRTFSGTYELRNRI